MKSVEFRRQREQHWRELEKLVDAAEDDGLASLSPEQIERMPSLYRATLSALSVTRAVALDANLNTYLESLSARAYFLVYGNKTPTWSVAWAFVLRGFPRAVRRCRGLVALAGLLLALGIATGFALTWDDLEQYYALMPPGDRRNPSASTESLKQTLYDTEHKDVLVAFAMSLFTHNAQVGFLAAALGFAAGLPTAYLLFFNGVVLGTFSALFARRGLGVEVWAWLLPHGITELLALVLCGAAGFAIADGLLFPGTLTRTASLQQRGRDVAPLIAGAVALLFVAGLIEGIFRQTVFDPKARLAVAAVTAIGWISYFGFAGRRGAP